MFEQLDDAIYLHCGGHGIRIGPEPWPATNFGRGPSALERTPPAPTGKPNAQGQRIWRMDPKGLTKFNFTLATLSAAPYGSNTLIICLRTRHSYSLVSS